MATHPSGRSTTRGLLVLAAAIGVSLVSFALGSIWSVILAIASLPPAVADPIRLTWLPISVIVLQGLVGLLGLLGFLFLWRGRWEVGAGYASRLGLAMLAALVSAVAFALFGVTGLLLGYVRGVEFLVPWHGLLAVVGGVFLGLALYGVLANLPIVGSRPLAAVALALGLGGIALVNLASIGLRRIRTGALEGAGLGLALASLTMWLVLCLWCESTLRSGTAVAPAASASQGT